MRLRGTGMGVAAVPAALAKRIDAFLAHGQGIDQPVCGQTWE